MKDRVLSLLLAAVMGLSLLPVTAFAATYGYSVWVNGEEFTKYKSEISCGSGTATLDTSTDPYTLTLENATITNAYYDYSGSSGAIFSYDDMKIVVKGDCRIELADSVGCNGIGTKDGLTIVGDGTLRITLKNTGFQGIEVFDDLTIAMDNSTPDSGILDIDCCQNAIHTIYNHSITIRSTTLNIDSSGEKGIFAQADWSDVVISDSSVTVTSAGDGIYGSDISCSNSSVTVTSGGNGICGSAVSCSESVVEISSGAIGISANGPYSDDGVSFTDCYALSITGKDAAVQSEQGDVLISESPAYLESTAGSAVKLLGDEYRKVSIKDNASPVTFKAASGSACISPSKAMSVENLERYAVTGGPGESNATYSRNPAVVVNKSQVGTPAAPAADPVYGVAETERKLFDFSVECYSGSPSPYAVEWKQGDDTWGDIAPAEGLFLSGKGEVSTTAATPAGSYIFRVKATELDPAFASDDAVLTVAKAIPPLEVSLTGWTYGQSANTPTVTGNTGNGAMTYSYKVKDADDSTYNTAVPTAAGTYTVRAQTAATDNYAAASATADFTICKATPTADILEFIAPENCVYDGSAKNARIEFNSDGSITGLGSITVKYQKKNGDGWDAAEGTAPTDAGTYKVLADVADGSNYNPAIGLTSDHWIFEITRAVPTVTAPAAVQNLTYNGKAQALVSSGSAAGGEIRYKLGGSGTYSAEIPTAADAGDYTVYYKVVGDGNHDDTTEASVDVSIARQTITVSGIAVADKVYNTRTDDVSITGYTLTGKVDGDELTLTGLTGTYASAAAGDAQTVNLSAASGWALDGAAKDNYVLAADGQPTAAAGKISAFDLSGAAVTLAPASGVYTGSAIEPAAAVTFDGTTPIPAADYEISYTNNVSAGTAAVTVTAGSGNVTNSRKAEFTIAKLTVTITPDADQKKTYGDDDPAFTYTNTDLCGTDEITGALSRVSGENAGEYAFILGDLSVGDNYELKIAESAPRFTVSPKQIIIRANDKRAHVGAALPELGEDDFTVTGLINGDGLITKPTLAYDGTQNMKEAGTYAILASGANAGDNYTISYEPGTLTVTRYKKPAGYEELTVIVPMRGEDGSIDVTAVVSGKTAAVQLIEEEALERIIGGDVRTGMVVIDLSGLKRDITVVKLPIGLVNAVADAAAETGSDTAGLALKLSSGMLEFDAKALKTVASAAGDAESIEFHLDKVGTTRLNAEQKAAVAGLTVAEGFDVYVTAGGAYISDLAGGTAAVYLLFEIPAGHDPAGYTVWYVAGDGTLERMNSVYESENHRFVVTHFSDYILTYDETYGGYDGCPRDETCVIGKFTDTANDFWWHDGIHYCVANGLMNGIADTLFNPNGITSRAMIVTMLWRLEGERIANYAMSFEDVAEEEWYTEAVRWAAAEKIVSGYDTAHFGPNDPITREQLATILYRYAQVKGQGFTGSRMFLLDFADRADISAWADEAVHWCSMKGIVTGKDGRIFDPQGNATRAETAVMMQRFCEALEK